MTKEHAEYLAAWMPEPKLAEKLRRMGLRPDVKIRVHRRASYTLWISLTLIDGDSKETMLSFKKRNLDDPAGYMMKMEIARATKPDPEAVNDTWRSMAKTCSTYLNLRTLQKVWD